MRRFALMFALVMTPALATTLGAAELDVPARPAPSDKVSMQKGPPNCVRWTDGCVNCTRGADGEAPVCSNIGFACQPKAIRCVGSEPATR
jgi:hypothetical protein